MKFAKKIIILMTFIVVLSLLTVFVSSASNDSTKEENEKGVQKVLRSSTNQTFAQCIQQSVKTRNDCYDETKLIKKTCDAQAKLGNQTVIKSKACNAEYKKSMTTCKSDFKNEKNKVCWKLKHSWWEGFKATFA